MKDVPLCRQFVDLDPLIYACTRTITGLRTSHIVGPDFQVLVRISDLTVIAGEVRPAQIAEAVKWAELNERG